MYNLEANSIKEFDWPIDYAYYRGIIKKLYKSRKPWRSARMSP